MRRSEAFPSKYIGKDDVKSPATVTIADVGKAMVRGDYGEEQKTVMSFREKDIKPLIVNTCNWIAIEDVYGEESDDWIGKPIELYVDKNVMFGGKRVGGIRVRIPVSILAARTFDAPPGTETISFSKAIDACAEVGISKETLVESLKAKGCKGYNATRDTHHVMEIIENVRSRVQSIQDPADVTTVVEDDIPF